jgi:glycosyltransferase involved in cell wall biosynthesis
MDMTGQSLKFSVVMPLFNKAAFVVEALNSVLAQTYPSHEIIVVDDGSTDESVSHIQSQSYPNLTLVRQSNAGVSVARNVGISAATGDFVVFLDADDRYRPNFLAALAKLADDFPGASILCTGYCRFTDNATQSIGSGIQPPPRGLLEDFYTEWCRTSFFSTISTAVRINAFNENEIFFPPGERLGEDQDVWFRLAEKYVIAFDPAILSEYRIGVEGSATQVSKVLNILPCYTRLAARLSNGKVPKRLVFGARMLLASHYLNVARARISVGDTDGATKLIRDPLARANVKYFLRTIALVYSAKLGLVTTK